MDGVSTGVWIPVGATLPQAGDGDGDMVTRSADVLITDGHVAYVGYLEYWDGDEKSTPEWKLKGRDGYSFDGVTHWMVLPPLPHHV